MKWKIRKDASTILFENGFYSESIILYWHILRFNIFDFLTRNNISYDSTREALKETVQYLSKKNSKDSENLCFFETVATLLEWDDRKTITEKEGSELREIFFELTKILK